MQRADQVDHGAAHRVLLAEGCEHTGQVHETVAARGGRVHVLALRHIAAAPVDTLQRTAGQPVHQRAGCFEVQRRDAVATLQQTA